MNESIDPVENSSTPIEISPDLLSADILRAVIEDFVLREGTDYGVVDYSLESKVLHVKKQILSGDVKIVYDQASESVTLMTKLEFKKQSQQSTGALA